MDVQGGPVTASNPRVSGDIGYGIVAGQEHVIGKPLVDYAVDAFHERNAMLKRRR